jgi:hypothetical protein
MTVAFDVKAALLAKTIADPAFADLVAVDAIWDSAYVGRERPRQLIWYGEITWDEDVPGALGNLMRAEQFNIRVGIEVHEGDETQTIANDKVEVLLNALYEMLRDPRALGLGNLLSVSAVPLALGEGVEPAGRAALLAAHIRVRARI